MTTNNSEQKEGNTVSIIGPGIALLIAGFGVGWMVGLSVSPVVSIVITSVVGAVAGLVGGLSGLEEQPKWKINPWPIAFLILGIVIGSVFGIQARTQDWFGTDVSDEIAMWQRTGLEMSQAQIAERLFERTYPSDIEQGPAAPSEQVQLAASSVLFSGAVSTEECEVFRLLAGDALRLELEGSLNDKLPQLAQMISDNDNLEWIVKEVICVEEE